MRLVCERVTLAWPWQTTAVTTRLRKIDHITRAWRISHSFRVPGVLRSAQPILKVALLDSAINFYSLFRWVRSFELWGRRTEGVVVTNDCGMKCRADCGLLRTRSQEVFTAELLAGQASREKGTCNIHHRSTIAD